MDKNDSDKWVRVPWLLLVRTIQKLASARSLNEIIEVIRSSARGIAEADGITVILRDGDYCHYVAEDAISPLWQGARFALTSCISGWCMLKRQSASIPDIFKDPRIPHDAYRPTFVKSLVMVPVGMDDPFAAIGAYWATAREPPAETLKLLETLAQSMATALRNVQFVDALQASEERSRLLFEQAAIGIKQVSLDGKLLAVNAALCRMLDYSREELLAKTYTDIIDARDRALEQALFESMLAGTRQSYVIEKRYIKKNGEPIWVRATWSLARKSGAPKYRISIVEDITARRRGDDEIKRQRSFLSLITQAAPGMIYMNDVTADRSVYLSGQLEATLGYTTDEFSALGNALRALMHPADFSLLGPHYDRLGVAEDGQAIEIEYRVRHKNGDWRWLLSRDTVWDRTSDGQVRHILGVAIDITQRKAHDLQQQLLLRELAHRVKNSLAVIQAMARHTMRTSRTTEHFVEAFEGRLASLAATHDMLAKGQWSGASLKELIQRQLSAFVGDRPARLALSGRDLILSPGDASTLSLIMHELGTNASKYGSFSTPTGTVSICWQVLDDDQMEVLRLDWRESGGPPVTPPETTGFGSMLLRSTATVDLRYEPAGFECDIKMPLYSERSTASRNGVAHLRDSPTGG
jgi:PAS domain S-box-containing protein